MFRNARQLPADDLSTGELLRQTLDETKELVRLEVALAREDLRSELKRAKTAGILLGMERLAGLLSVTAVIIALGNTVSAALIVAFLVVAEVAVFGFIGYRKLPKAPLQRTRERLTSDVRELKEHVVR